MVRVQICVRTIGSVAIDVGKRRLGPSSGRLFTLLFYLASRRDHLTSRRVVQELLFPNAENGRGAHSLRQLLYRLRQIGVPLETDSDQLRLQECDVTVDWWRFTDGTEIGAAELEQLSQGLLPGYSPTESEGFREWFEAERADISRRLTRRLTKELPHYREGGRWDLMDGAARVLLTLDPLSEEGTLARAEALASSGRKSAALSVIAAYVADLGETQPNLHVAPEVMRRRISERLPDITQQPLDERFFVGREPVLRMLSAVTTAARTGSPTIILLWGEPGIGKTRLLAEYRALASMQGAATFSLTCQPHDVFRPLGALCDLVAQLLEAPGALGCDPEARALLYRLVSVNEQMGDGREQEAAGTPLPSIIRSLSDLVSAVATECVLAIFVDDAHCMDADSSRALLATLHSGLPKRACLFMASRDRSLCLRVAEHSDRIKAIRLPPLTQEAVRELIRSLLPKKSDREFVRIEQAVSEQARGNPFFIRLLCSHFVATGDLRSLNHTLNEILQRRLAQLSPDAMRTLEACVILAHNCTFSRLERMLQLPRHQLLRAVEELDDRGLIRDALGHILSSHALLSDTIVAGMSQPVLRGLHLGAAQVLQCDADDSNALRMPWDCAEHWRQAGEHSTAIRELRSCAERAILIGRPRDAFAAFAHSLTLDSSDRTRLDLLESALNTLWASLDFWEAEPLLQERQTLRSKLGLADQQHDTFEVLGFAAALHSERDPTANISLLRECIQSSAPTAHRLSSGSQLIMIADLTRDADLATFTFETVGALDVGSLNHQVFELEYHTIFGDPKKAIAVANSLSERRSELLPRGEWNCSDAGFLSNIGYTHFRVGDWEFAHDSLLLAITAARRNELMHAEIHATMTIAQLCWSLEHVEECMHWHQRLSQLSTSHAFRSVRCEYNVLGARLALDGRNLEQGASCLNRAKESGQSSLALLRAHILACEIELDLARGQDPCSEAALSELMSLHVRAAPFGGHDDVAASVAHALVALGRLEAAGQLVEHYLTVRRDGFPIGSKVARLQQELSVIPA